ncbi:MAG TPA: hypothetical protein VIO57_10285 [Chloroflexota bacterium]|jgi:hypothetical protein
MRSTAAYFALGMLASAAHAGTFERVWYTPGGPTPCIEDTYSPTQSIATVVGVGGHTTQVLTKMPDGEIMVVVTGTTFEPSRATASYVFFSGMADCLDYRSRHPPLSQYDSWNLR